MKKKRYSLDPIILTRTLVQYLILEYFALFKTEDPPEQTILIPLILIPIKSVDCLADFDCFMLLLLFFGPQS